MSQGECVSDGEGLVVLFLSCGRSGTQWLAEVLSRTYGDLAVVTHEPLKRGYFPKRFFRRPEAYATSPDGGLLADHMDWVAEVTERRIYFETGWPCFPAIPLFRDRFGDRLRLVHLVRHPVPTAASLVTHQYYDPDCKTEVVLTGQLEPLNHLRLHAWNISTRHKRRRGLSRPRRRDTYVRRFSERTAGFFDARRRRFDPQTARKKKAPEITRQNTRNTVLPVPSPGAFGGAAVGGYPYISRQARVVPYEAGQGGVLIVTKLRTIA
jgi:hypothetical protein